ncbi:succinate dehydrogenase [ubiquinone] cytochrome b subunit, mitochondrial-like [Daucus carota subsp. sativus]|uniref:succinate dehydrogenase [ubiquinone] cytochrome b subunit, mitochondrial-like n=1 Tax=Daucus carota subsp. sativus TaxID=79200 RepID=UPI0007F0248E|nr:PREDICTED: succinate dehydrogenase [ubiquinone] cytochrome b subunit, mitochondrial-like [Daucus carota subsp. sativus]
MALRAAISRRVMNPSLAYATRSISSWRNVDSQRGATEAFVADPTANKLDTGFGGAYPGYFGKPEINRQYSSMGETVNAIDEKLKLAFGENSNLIKAKGFVHGNEERALAMKSQLQQFVRPLYRNPVHGALIGSTVLGNSFSLANIRTSHSQAGVTLGSGGVSAKLRPLSPHLTVYKPQSTSTSSIFHRIAYIYMGVAALFYYLLYLKMGMICFTYEKFYQFFYYASGLFPIINELSVVALAYYVFKGAAQYIKFR